MRRRPEGPAHFLLVASIVGAILGMELDVMSGPVAPDSLSVLLCELETPNPARVPVGRTARPDTWFLIPTLSTSATSTPIHADEFNEPSSELFDAVWPSPITVSPNRQCAPSGARIVSHVNLMDLRVSPRPPRPRLGSMTATAAKLPLQLCRLLI